MEDAALAQALQSDLLRSGRISHLAQIRGQPVSQLAQAKSKPRRKEPRMNRNTTGMACFL